MAYQSFLDAGGSTSYRKVTGAGTTGDPVVCHQIIDSGTVAATQSGTWNITNVSGTISLPTGAATSANQTTIIGHVDGIETTLTSIDGKITACNTGAVVLAAGTAAIGKLAANTGVTIGAVEIAASQTLATVTNLSQMGGAAIAMGTGVRSAGTQRVTIATDDVVPVTGTFWQATQPVSLASVPSHAVTNAGTFAVQVDGAGLTSLQLLDDAVATVASAITSKGFAAVGTDGTNARVIKTDSSGELQVDVLTLPALAAGTNLIGKTASGLDVSNLYDGSTALTPKFAKLSSASTGNQALVSAVVGKKIRVLALHVMATASTNSIYVNDGTADLYADSTRKIPLDVTGAAGPGGISLPFNPVGWFETAATNRPLNINLTSANGIVAVASYVEV